MYPFKFKPFQIYIILLFSSLVRLGIWRVGFVDCILKFFLSIFCLIWFRCSVTCGVGVREKKRVCVAGTDKSSSCIGPTIQSDRCDIGPCPSIAPYTSLSGVISYLSTTQPFFLPTSWSDWEFSGPCSAACGSGTRRRTRICVPEIGPGSEKGCPGVSEELVKCEVTECTSNTADQVTVSLTDGYKIDESHFSSWTQWSQCDGNCQRTRIRYCQSIDGKLPAGCVDEEQVKRCGNDDYCNEIYDYANDDDDDGRSAASNDGISHKFNRSTQTASFISFLVLYTAIDFVFSCYLYYN